MLTEKMSHIHDEKLLLAKQLCSHHKRNAYCTVRKKFTMMTVRNGINLKEIENTAIQKHHPKSN